MVKVADSAVPVACWSCSVMHDEAALFCPNCGKIQPPPGGDYFSVFGLEPRLNIDVVALEGEFHRLSRRLHPDRFARGTESEREWSLADTALLNDAYRTLKDPLRRSEYVLALRGARNGTEIGEEGNGRDGRNAARAPNDLLEEVFDLNMQLEEMRLRRQSGNVDRQGGKVDRELEENLHAAKRKFETLRDEVDRDLRRAWNDWDGGDAMVRSAAEKTMAGLLDRRRYLSNLVRDVSQALGA
jgi:molecular chaperone HscB